MAEAVQPKSSTKAKKKKKEKIHVVSEDDKPGLKLDISDKTKVSFKDETENTENVFKEAEKKVQKSEPQKDEEKLSHDQEEKDKNVNVPETESLPVLTTDVLIDDMEKLKVDEDKSSAENVQNNYMEGTKEEKIETIHENQNINSEKTDETNVNNDTCKTENVQSEINRKESTESFKSAHSCLNNSLELKVVNEHEEVVHTKQLDIKNDFSEKENSVNLYPNLKPDLEKLKRSAIEQKEQHRKESSQIRQHIIQPLTLEQLKSLYYNPRLIQIDAIVDMFIQEDEKKDNHEFYEILLSYLRARKNLIQSEGEIKVLHEQYTAIKEQSWVTSKHFVTAKGPCGDGVTCKANHQYEMIDFDDDAFKRLKKSLETIRENLQTKLSLHSYSSQLARLQVESYIHNLFITSPLLRDIPSNAPPQALGLHSPNNQHQINRLRDCITVLYMFHRRPVSDNEFVINTRGWTQRLVSALVKVASFDDHMFILNHILRCPAGVGTWAANFIQMPAIPQSVTSFGNPALDHYIACLALVLTPIRAREDFVCLMREAVNTSPDPQQVTNPWVLINCDGEEDEDPKNAWKYLLENDFVAILKQFPVSEMFKHVLLITGTDNFHYDIHRTTESTFIKQLAFSTCLIRILGEGLQTYNMARYRQLNKRIGGTIREVVGYVSNHLESFLSHNSLPDDMVHRLQLEYDQFFLRATNCILTSQKLGSWQFMTNTSYATVSRETMWKLLWLLHQGTNQNIDIDSLPTENKCREYINDCFSTMQLADIVHTSMISAETIYLLTALAHMASCRPPREFDFIQAVSFRLFEICYVCAETREMCHKLGRDLLVSIATTHPFIISLIIQQTNLNLVNIGGMSLYLFQTLPFHLWLPMENDITVIEEWLMTSELTSKTNQLAQSVLSNINWGVDQQKNRLFIPYDVHKKTAILLTQAYGKFIGSRHHWMFFTEGMKQVASVVKQQQTNEQLFNNWAWDIALKLHLHHTTLPPNDVQLVNAEGGPPDLANDNSFLPVTRGLKERNAMACYVAILVSNIGHKYGDFIPAGLEYLSTLSENFHYKPTINVLNCIVHMFFEYPHILTDNEKFQKIIQSLMVADESASKLSKIIWSQEFPGPFTKWFTTMIEGQLSTFVNQGNVEGVMRGISFWIKMLTKPPKWYHDKNSCYVLDQTVKSAFRHKSGLDTVKAALQEAFQRHQKETHQQGAVSQFVNWVSSGANFSQIPSLTEVMCNPELFGWLSLVLLDMEFTYEKDTQLWHTFREEIYTDSKASPSHALKKCVSRLKLEQAPGLNSMTIYRFSRFMLDLPIDHPVMPLICQRFFLLFLGRQVSQASNQHRASVGEKMFEVSGHSGTLKKIKKRFNEAINLHMDYPTAISESNADDQSNNIENFKYVPKKEFHLNLARLYQTYQLWVDEPFLHDAKLYIPALPVQYDTGKLLQMFQNQTNLWFEYVDIDRIIYELSQTASEWYHSAEPGSPRKSYLHHTDHIKHGADGILSALKKAELPAELPPLQPVKPPVPDISTTVLEDKSTILHVLKSDLNVIKEYAKSFHSRCNHQVAIDDDFCTLLPKLHYNNQKQVKVTTECKSHINPLHKCSNPAVINVNIREKARDENVQRQIDENRAEYKQLLIEGQNPPPVNICVAVVHMENALTMLVKLFRSSKDDIQVSRLNDTVCTLFFQLAESINDDIQFYPPARQFYSSCIDLLGMEFMQKDPSQTENILQFSLDSPRLAGLISPHFIPLNSPRIYVTMYEKLVQILKRDNPDLVFVLLTKFDIPLWLSTINPAQIEMKRLIDVLGIALYSCGIDPDKPHSLVFALYCSHLKSLLNFHFPCNLNDLLGLILKGSVDQALHENCWQILNKCIFEVNEEGSNETQKMTVLSIDQIRTVLHQLGDFFLQSRLLVADNSAFGLYPCLARYIDEIRDLIRDLLLCLMHKILPNMSDMNPISALDTVWQTIVHTYAPWIQTIQNEKTQLLPWIQSDAESGTKMVESAVTVFEQVFTCFADLIPPYQPNTLGKVWMYYAGVLCHKLSPPHIINVYTSVLSQLPWKHLKPDSYVLQSMIQFKELKCNEGFDLLAHIVCELDWAEILQVYQQVFQDESLALSSTLILLIQCFGEQKHIEIPALEPKIVSAINYNWIKLTSDNYRHAFNWYLQMCDPKYLIAERSSTVTLGLRLLKAASDFNVQSSVNWTSDMAIKRQCYVHSYVQLICQCTYDNEISMESITTVILNLMTDIETVVASVVDSRIQQEESLDLMKEVLSLLNNCNPSNQSVVVTTIIQWLESSPSSILLLPCVRSASRCLASHRHMVQIIEECIQAYFVGGHDKQTGGGWDHVLAAIQVPDLDIDDYLTVALEEGSYLLLYGYIVQNLPLCQSLEQMNVLLGRLLDWTGKAKPSSDNECKLLLWWSILVDIVLKEVNFGASHKVLIKMLNTLISHLHQYGEDRLSTGLLGAIGLGKKSPMSQQFRIVCRALAAMLSAQIFGESLLRCPGEPAVSTSSSKQQLTFLHSLKSNRQYHQFKSDIQMSCDFVTSPDKYLADTVDLLGRLSTIFYSDKKFLSVLHNFHS
ncbi:ectopic P granules protein 5 homolog isoform X1 [Mytilus trossulus]|uniref:ectopic P granules protein 5 homolog isoform X1 n=2 Tax=Mytilus trossulus TaxID=6551 RepID=UPI0030045F37